MHQLPRLELQGHVQPITRSVLRVELILTPDFQFDDAVRRRSSSPLLWFLRRARTRRVLSPGFFLPALSLSEDFSLFGSLAVHYFVAACHV